MDRLPPLSPESFVEKMRGEVERVLGEVAEAVMALETIEQGHQWAQYWATCLHTMN